MNFKAFWNKYIEEGQDLDHKIVLEIFSQPLSPKIDKEYDLVDTLLSISQYYEEHRQFEELHEVLKVVQNHNKSLYDDMSFYYYETLLDYYCYHAKGVKVREVALGLSEKPIEGLDIMLKGFRKVIFYSEYPDLLEQWAEMVYSELVDEADKFVNSPDFEFALVKHFLELEKVSDPSSFDWPSFGQRAKDWGFEFSEKHLHFFRDGLAMTPEESAATFRELALQDHEESMQFLQIAFMKYMKPKGMSFATSGKLWNYFMEFLEERTDKPARSEFFFFKTSDFYTFVEGQSGMIMDYRFLSAAILWGTPHAFDFLADLQLITREKALEHQSLLHKMQRLFLLENYINLWQYDFVRRWPVPADGKFAMTDEEGLLFSRSLQFSAYDIPLASSQDDLEIKDLRKQLDIVEPINPEWDEPFSFSEEPKMPVKAARKIGRNEKVTVKYVDGKVVKDVKYKKVMRDLEEGMCSLVE